MRSHALQVFVVLEAPHLEVEAQVQDRLRQRPLGTQEQRDEESSEATIAVEKRVNGLELHVGEPGLDQRWRPLGLVVQELLERAHALDHTVGGRGTKRALPGRDPPIQT